VAQALPHPQQRPLPRVWLSTSPRCWHWETEPALLCSAVTALPASKRCPDSPRLEVGSCNCFQLMFSKLQKQLVKLLLRKPAEIPLQALRSRTSGKAARNSAARQFGCVFHPCFAFFECTFCGFQVNNCKPLEMLLWWYYDSSFTLP